MYRVNHSRIVVCTEVFSIQRRRNHLHLQLSYICLCSLQFSMSLQRCWTHPWAKWSTLLLCLFWVEDAYNDHLMWATHLSQTLYRGFFVKCLKLPEYFYWKKSLKYVKACRLSLFCYPYNVFPVSHTHSVCFTGYICENQLCKERPKENQGRCTLGTQPCVDVLSPCIYCIVPVL